MTKKQMRSFHLRQVCDRIRWLDMMRKRALALRGAHADQRREAHSHYHRAKQALTYAREQLARCQPTKRE